MSKYRKALKNYTTKANLSKMVSDIQQILIDFGARGIGYGYDDQGRIESIHFRVIFEGAERVVTVPVMFEKVAEALSQQRVYKNDDHAYRVAIANVRDWLDAQLAYLATKQVEFPQIFLPYMVNNLGKTFYEVVKENKFLLEALNE